MTASSLRQWTVDAFASGPFRGNPACVVEPLDAWPSDVWMQALAQENNQAETAFMVRDPADLAHLAIRWFTPGIEAPFCGHATLASAHVLLSEMGLHVPHLTFSTRWRGDLLVEREGEGYRLDFPADPPRRVEVEAGLAAALGAVPCEVWAGQYLLVVLEGEAAVRALTPNIPALAPLGVEASSGPGNVIVAAVADEASPYNVVSRFFGPGSAIAEDPTTGSAHCVLAPLFAQKLGKSRLNFHQAFPGRGGDLRAEVAGDRVILSGRAVTTVESRLRVRPS